MNGPSLASSFLPPSSTSLPSRLSPMSSPSFPASPLSSPDHSPPARSTPTNDDIEAIIKMATSSHQSVDRPLRDTRSQLFVGNLPFRVRWQDLKDLFRRAGTVLRADVSLGPDNRSRGYGTVLLATAEDAGRAIDMFNGYSWQTRVLEVRPDRLGAPLDADLNTNHPFQNHSVPLVQQGLNLPVLSALNNLDELTISLPGNGELLCGGTGMRTLFVGNLPFHIQWQDLKDLFRAAGPVARADVALGPDGRSRGFGTVTFVTEDGAERARRMFDGYEFNGRPLKVHYDKFAQSSQNNPLGVSPQPGPATLLPPYDSLSQLTSPLSRLEVVSAHDGRPHPHLDSFVQSQLHLDLQRSRLEVESRTSTQLDTLLARPRSSSFKSPLTPPNMLSQSPSHLQLQGQSLSASVAQPNLPPVGSQPHSLTASPLPIPASVSSNSASLRSFGTTTDLTLVTDLNDQHTPDSFSSLGTSFGSPRPTLSAGSSQTSSFSSSGSWKPNVSVASRADILSDGIGLGLGSQRTGSSRSARPSFGAANTDKPSFGIGGSDRLVLGTSSEKLPLGPGNSKRLSTGLTTLQHPGSDTLSQRSTPHASVPFTEDNGSTPPSVHMSVLGNTTFSSLASAPLGLTHPKAGSLLASTGLASKSASPPLVGSSNIGGKLSDLSRVGSPDSRGSQASPSLVNAQIPLRSTVEEMPSGSSMLVKSILNIDPSPALDTTWNESKPQVRKENPAGKINGTVDYVATALGALGMRRANKVQSKQTEERRKSTPSGEQQSYPSSSAGAQGSGKKSTQSSSHRHPGPISLPPPTTFALPPGVVFSPHAHPQSPIYHPGYPLSPVHPHPMGSPLGSPLHHPALHSPLHHPGHPQYGAYPHHAAPVHYGVITPHGLPPITPSMPPFTFLPPQGQVPVHNGHARKESEEQSQHVPRNEGSPTDPSTAQASQSAYYPHTSNAPQQRIQYTQIHPHMFSPGIPLSPGVMVPLSPGIVPPGVSMPMASVPVPMTPGVALTPGVTVTPGAFWPHAPWINPAVGAPVHAANGPYEQSHGGVEGYFPPISQPSGDMGYFPPVLNIAHDVLKEGHGLVSESGSSHGDNTQEELGRKGGASENSPRSSSPGKARVLSPDPSSKSPQDSNRKGVPPQIMKRSSSAQCEGGLPKRNGLLHRESDPEVTAVNKGSKEA